MGDATVDSGGPGEASAAAVLEWLRTVPGASEGVAVGEGYQAAVHRVDSPYGPLVVKRAHAHGVFARLFKSSVTREASVYARLRGVPGIARCYGLLGDDALVLEYVPSASYRARQRDLKAREVFFAELLEVLRRMHAAGVAHGDLKRKDNLLVADDGDRPYVIDFGVACLRRQEGGFVNRLWFEWFKQMDYNAWVKLKYGSKLVGVSPADSLLYRELFVERLARRLRRLFRVLLPRR